MDLNKNPPFFIKFEYSKVHSLTGLTYNWFKYIIKELFNSAGSAINYLYFNNNNSINRFKEIFKLSSKGMKLLTNCIRWNVFNRYFPKYQMSGHYYFTDRYPYWDNKIENERNRNFCNSGGEWIDAYEISDRIFIDKNLNLLYEYYKKTPLEIAHQYKENPNSVLKDQIDRLKMESDNRVIKVLEPYVPIDDPVLNYLISKFSIKKSKKHKIEELFNLPLKLPNLISLEITGKNLKKLDGISKDLSKVQDLIINSTCIQDLRGLPENLPSLQRLEIISHIYYENNSSYKFKSFRGLPNKLPNLKNLSLNYSELQNFDNLPPILPSLEEIICKNQPLSNFLGFPKEIPNFKCLYLEYCDIYIHSKEFSNQKSS